MSEDLGVDFRAVVHPRARIGRDVFIGPYCAIGAEVTVGDGCRLESHVTVQGPTEIGPGIIEQIS